MATAQGLYAQVVMVRRKGSDNEKGELKKKKYKFQGKSSRLMRWFYIDHERDQYD